MLLYNPHIESPKPKSKPLTNRLMLLFQSHKSLFFLAAALFWMIVMCFLNNKFGISWKEILVEANGMVFDLLVFGVLLTIYENISEKRAKIERLKEEIDDYRRWDEKEAMYRIVGVVKRLLRLGYQKVDLSDCYLNEAKLFGTNLSSVNLTRANLIRAKINGSNLTRANLSMANLTEANLYKANLYEVSLVGANLHKANLNDADLVGADLYYSNLSEAKMKGAKLSRANLSKANLKDSNLTFEQLAESRTLFACENLEDSIRIRLEQSHAHLFLELKEE